MARKKKAVISADPAQLAEVQGLIRARRYRTVSEFVRVAINEKLQRLHAEQLADEVDRYIAGGHTFEDEELISAQAFGRRRGAKR